MSRHPAPKATRDQCRRVRDLIEDSIERGIPFPLSVRGVRYVGSALSADGLLRISLRSVSGEIMQYDYDLNFRLSLFEGNSERSLAGEIIETLLFPLKLHQAKSATASPSEWAPLLPNDV